MSDTVWKYRLFITGGVQYVQMPAGAELLKLDVQNGEAMLWARVSIQSDAPMVARRFEFVGTGHHVRSNTGHVGTILLNGGALVLHLFELVGAP